MHALAEDILGSALDQLVVITGLNIGLSLGLCNYDFYLNPPVETGG